jgi:endonuclease/exonuclease/phosphatase family metal-dependent hydrolase
MKKILFFSLLASIICAACCKQENEPIRVSSYNIRMDTPADSLNAWSYRKDKVNALIRFWDMDIVGTQEGFLHQLQDMARMPEYAYFGSGRDDGKTAGEHSAIFYKTDRFELLETGDFWLSETPNVPGKGWDATCCNRICSWGKLKEKKTGKVFYAFNVHFDHQGVVARQESGKLMIQKMKEIAQDNMIICMGDFNSHPQTEQIIALSAFLHDSKFLSQAPPYGPEGTTNRGFANPLSLSRIDYIFVSEGMQVLKYASLTDNDGNHYPSDHIPVMADVVLK